MHKADIRIILKDGWKYVFLDSEHVRMGRMNSSLPPPTKKIICFFILYAWFLKIILLVHDFFLLQLSLSMQSKPVSHNSKDSVWSKFYVAFFDKMFLKW